MIGITVMKVTKTEKTMKLIRKHQNVLLEILVISFFLVMFFIGEMRIAPDSQQYIDMNVRREPLYPLFLAFNRWIFGENYLNIVSFLQNMMAAASILVIAFVLNQIFELSFVGRTLVIFISVVPYIMTPLFSVTHVFIPNMVMSEALSIPLVTLFLAQIIRFIYHKRISEMIISVFLAWLCSLCRGQLQFLLLVCFVVSVFVWLSIKSEISVKAVLLNILLSFVILVIAFSARSIGVKTYNYYVNGYYIDTPYNYISFVTNMIYASDKEIAGSIEDENTRYFFNEMIDLILEQHKGYTDSLPGMLGRAQHIEQEHDNIKFYIIEQTLYEQYAILQTGDYTEQSILENTIAGDILKTIFPEVLPIWIYGYLSLMLVGFIRSVAIVHPLLNWYALLLYLSALLLMFICFKRNRKTKAGRLMLFALLIICGNVASTALVIMCLSRYMIYGMSLFYISYLMMLLELIKTGKHSA